jgi:transcription elongation factor Elf1
MNNPFPIPEEFECPFCGKMTVGEEADRFGHIYCICSREVVEKVGGVEVSLYSRHTFIMKWDGREWVGKKIKHEQTVRTKDTDWKTVWRK